MSDHPAFTDERMGATVLYGVNRGGVLTDLKDLPLPLEVVYDGQVIDLPIYYLDMDRGLVCFYARNSDGEYQFAPCGTELVKECRIVADPNKLQVRPIPKN